MGNRSARLKAYAFIAVATLVVYAIWLVPPRHAPSQVCTTMGDEDDADIDEEDEYEDGYGEDDEEDEDEEDDDEDGV